VVDDKKLTVGEYLDRWLNDAVRGTIRETTFSRDKYLVTNHIRPTIGRVKLKNLNALHLTRLYRQRLDSGLSGSMVQKIHHVLHKGLGQAVRWHLIPRNPADDVKAPTPAAKEMHPLSAEEARGLLDAARGDKFEALYVLAVHTGMRRGELLGLKWDDVDLENASVRVRRTLTRIENGRRLALGPPKNKQSRHTVRLTERAVEFLRSHLERQLAEIDPSGTATKTSASEAVGGAGILPRMPLSTRSPSSRSCGKPRPMGRDGIASTPSSVASSGNSATTGSVRPTLL
jgi:integrase